MSDMKNRITHADAEQLLAGRTPEGRPGLAVLAAALTEFRSATIDTTPQPSTELATRLAANRDVDAAPTIARAGERVSRFGLAARVAVGVVALLLGVTIAGAAGALPGGVQDAFDDLVSTVIPGGDDGPAILDEDPADGDDVRPEEDSSPGDEAGSPSEDAEPGDGEEPEGDQESGEPDEDPGDDEPESDSDSDSSDPDD